AAEMSENPFESPREPLDIDETIRIMASGSPPAASSIDDCEPLIDALYIRRTTRGLDRLARLPNLRTIRAAGLRDAEFESLCNAAGLTHLAVFGSRISDLTPLRRLTRLRALTMTGNTKARTLDGLEALRELEYLALAEFTGSFSLEPVGRLDELRFLWLSGTTWTPMRVDSLGPLSALRRLERLQLPGVRVADRKLAALRGL